MKLYDHQHGELVPEDNPNDLVDAQTLQLSACHRGNDGLCQRDCYEAPVTAYERGCDGLVHDVRKTVRLCDFYSQGEPV